MCYILDLVCELWYLAQLFNDYFSKSRLLVVFVVVFYRTVLQPRITKWYYIVCSAPLVLSATLTLCSQFL